jgi:two-component system LytT family response regulator
MNIMRAIIIEDEIQSRKHLTKLLSQQSTNILIVGDADSVDSGLELIHKTSPDLVFLDIRLSQQTGFDLLSQLGNFSFDVIFVSGFDQYGIPAIKFSALDYIMKPIRPTELFQAIQKALIRQAQKNTQAQIANLLSIVSETKKSVHRIALPLMKELRFVYPEEIIRCEAANNYTYFHIKPDERLLVSKGMFEFEDILQEYGFIRCHQSHIVNKKYVKSITREDYSAELLLCNGEKVPISRHRLVEVKDAINR